MLSLNEWRRQQLREFAGPQGQTDPMNQAAAGSMNQGQTDPMNQAAAGSMNQTTNQDVPTRVSGFLSWLEKQPNQKVMAAQGQLAQGAEDIMRQRGSGLLGRGMRSMYQGARDRWKNWRNPAAANQPVGNQAMPPATNTTGATAPGAGF